MSKTRSPIREDEKPLPLPGESLREQLDELVSDRLLFLYPTAIAALLAAMASWATYLFSTVVVPIFMSIAAGGYLVYFIYKLIPGIRHARFLRLGIEGERAVAGELEKLRSDPCVIEVLHDVGGMTECCG